MIRSETNHEPQGVVQTRDRLGVEPTGLGAKQERGFHEQRGTVAIDAYSGLI